MLKVLTFSDRPQRVFVLGTLLVAVAVAAFVLVHLASARGLAAQVEQERRAALGRETDLEIAGSPLRVVRAATLTPQKLVAGSGTVVQLTVDSIALPSDLRGFDRLDGMLRAALVADPATFDVQPIDDGWKATTEPRFMWKWQVTAKTPARTFINYVVDFRSSPDGAARRVLSLDDAVAVAGSSTAFVQQVVIQIVAPGGLLVVILTSLAARRRKPDAPANADAKAPA